MKRDEQKTKKQLISELGEMRHLATGLEISETECKQAYERIGELSYAIDRSPGTIIITDVKGNIQYVNRMFTEISGYTREEVIDRNPRFLQSGKTPPGTYRTLWQTITSGSEWRGEFLNRRKDGRLYWESAVISPIMDSGGVITGFIAAKENVTERKRAEEELEGYRVHLEEMIEERTKELRITNDQLAAEITERRQAEQEQIRLASFPELNPDSIIETDLDGTATYLNPTARKQFPDLVAAGDAHPIIKDLMSAVTTLQSRKKKGLVLETEFDNRVYEQHISCITESKRVRSYIEDVTERRQAEERLRRSEESLRRYLDAAPDAVYICDLDGMCIYGNEKAEKITGYSRDELIGKSFLDLNLLTAEHLAKVPELLGLSRRDELAGPEELDLRRKDGSHVPVEISTVTIKQDEGPVVLGFVRDISERKRLEEQLIVADRLATIGELASGIAHELNNPLTSVIGFSELVMDKEVPENIRGHLEIIHREAKRTSGIVRNLLTFARRHAPTKEPVDIHRVIQAVLDLRAYEEKVSNLEVSIHFAPDLPEIIADRFQLQQVFLNIIINAEQAMLGANGRGTLTITSERSGETLRISFADDGPGISKEDLGHVFDPFFTTKEVGKGTGLGLSICYGIVGEHGGRIYAESEVGRGTTFIVELPIDGQS